jgi:hypothetical protein
MRPAISPARPARHVAVEHLQPQGEGDARGGMITTATDLARLVDALLGGKLLSSPLPC